MTKADPENHLAAQMPSRPGALTARFVRRIAKRILQP
jgi:hypothetical protein